MNGDVNILYVDLAYKAFVNVMTKLRLGYTYDHAGGFTM